MIIMEYAPSWHLKERFREIDIFINLKISIIISWGRLVLRLNTREPFVENVNEIIQISLDEVQNFLVV